MLWKSASPNQNLTRQKTKVMINYTAKISIARFVSGCVSDDLVSFRFSYRRVKV